MVCVAAVPEVDPTIVSDRLVVFARLPVTIRVALGTVLVCPRERPEPAPAAEATPPRPIEATLIVPVEADKLPVKLFPVLDSVNVPGSVRRTVPMVDGINPVIVTFPLPRAVKLPVPVKGLLFVSVSVP